MVKQSSCQDGRYLYFPGITQNINIVLILDVTTCFTTALHVLLPTTVPRDDKDNKLKVLN